MLIRQTKSGTFECITQEHHAFLSGWLANHWAADLDPRLLAGITLHDNPWRDADLEPAYDAERSLPHDFISYPLDEKLALYQNGIDELELIDPYIALLVSLHYTTFAGTRDIAELQIPEAKRRSRLEDVLGDFATTAESSDLKWLKFFDVLSLFITLTGPEANHESVPAWLSATENWSTAPDGTSLSFSWRSDTHLEIAPWPFRRASLKFDVRHVNLVHRPRSEDEMREMLANERGSRLIVMAPG